MYVTTYALGLIKTDHDVLKRKHDSREDIGPCTRGFKKSMGLPCQAVGISYNDKFIKVCHWR